MQTCGKKPYFDIKPLLSSRSDHIAKMVNLDESSSESRWTMARFVNVLGRPRTHGVGAFDRKGNLCGYMIFDSEAKVVRVVSMLVHKDYRRRGIGSMLLDCLQVAMRSISKPIRIVCTVIEDNDSGVKFLKTYAARSGASLRTSLIRGEPLDLYNFVFTESEEPSLCV